MESGELGLEEHVPINPPKESAHKAREPALIDSDEEADQDANEMDEMYVHPG